MTLAQTYGIAQWRGLVESALASVSLHASVTFAMLPTQTPYPGIPVPDVRGPGLIGYVNFSGENDIDGRYFDQRHHVLRLVPPDDVPRNLFGVVGENPAAVAACIQAWWDKIAKVFPEAVRDTHIIVLNR